MSEIVKTTFETSGITFYDRCGGWVRRIGDGMGRDWMDNNPGSLPRGNPLRPGEVDDTGGNPNAVFESLAAGQAAMDKHWQDLGNSLPERSNLWDLFGAAGFTNVEDIEQASGLDFDMKIAELTSQQFRTLMNAIRQTRGLWEVGQQTAYHAGSGSGNCPGFDPGHGMGGGGNQPPADDPTWRPFTR